MKISFKKLRECEAAFKEYKKTSIPANWLGRHPWPYDIWMAAFIAGMKSARKPLKPEMKE